MKFEEWRIAHARFLNVQSIDTVIGDYADYYHAEMSKPPKDVEEVIKTTYKDIEYVEGGLSKSSIRLHNEHMERMREAARFGYSLATKVDWDKFEQWIADKYFAYHDGDWYWESDTEGDMPLKLQYLYDLFMQQPHNPTTPRPKDRKQFNKIKHKTPLKERFR